MASTSAYVRSPKLTMKLLVDTEAQRVVYAEAPKDVVDVLFSFLTLPIGTAVMILSKESMPGSVGNLYGSVEKLDEIHVSTAAKNALLAPVGDYDVVGKLFHLHRHADASSGSGEPGFAMPSLDGSTGFVKGMVTYSVMDDLTVVPMSSFSISGFTIIVDAFGTSSYIRRLKEMTVQLGYEEILEIFRASLHSKTVLSDVFLGKMKQKEFIMNLDKIIRLEKEMKAKQNLELEILHLRRDLERLRTHKRKRSANDQ